MLVLVLTVMIPAETPACVLRPRSGRAPACTRGIYVALSICLSIYLSIYQLSKHMSIYLSLSLYIYMYVCMYVCMYACMYVCISISYLSAIYLSIYLCMLHGRFPRCSIFKIGPWSLELSRALQTGNIFLNQGKGVPKKGVHVSNNYT